MRVLFLAAALLVAAPATATLLKNYELDLHQTVGVTIVTNIDGTTTVTPLGKAGIITFTVDSELLPGEVSVFGFGLSNLVVPQFVPEPPLGAVTIDGDQIDGGFSSFIGHHIFLNDWQGKTIPPPFDAPMGPGTWLYSNFQLGNLKEWAYGTYTFSQVPEPTTIALFSIALAGLGFARRRKLR